MPVSWRANDGVVEIDLCQSQLRLGRFDPGAQPSASDLDRADILLADRACGLCLGERCLRLQQRGTGLVAFARRDRAVGNKGICAAHVGLRPHQLCAGIGDARILRTKCRGARPLGLCRIRERGILRGNIRPRLFNAGPVNAVVDRCEDLALSDLREIDARHRRHIAADLRADDRHATLHIGIVGAFGAASERKQLPSIEDGKDGKQSGRNTEQCPPARARGRYPFVGGQCLRFADRLVGYIIHGPSLRRLGLASVAAAR